MTDLKTKIREAETHALLFSRGVLINFPDLGEWSISRKGYATHKMICELCHEICEGGSNRKYCVSCSLEMRKTRTREFMAKKKEEAKRSQIN